MSARDFRQQQRAKWGEQAAGWERRADLMRAATMPVAAWMVDEISPQPGDALLELAAGPGDTGFLALELAKPGGTLISSDFVPEMLTVAQRRAEELGVSDVRFKQIDAEAEIDLPAASVDGLLCRWGFMLMNDPAAALRESRRVLRPGGRIALAAWTAPEENRWAQIPGRLLIERGLAEPPDPAAPGQFAWARDGLIGAALEQTGFLDATIERLEFTLAYPSFDAYVATIADLSSEFGAAVRSLPESELDDLRINLHARVAEFATGEGDALAIPAATWVAAASA